MEFHVKFFVQLFFCIAYSHSTSWMSVFNMEGKKHDHSNQKYRQHLLWRRSKFLRQILFM